MQHDGNKDWLAVHGGAEQFRNGNLLLSHHLLALLLHLLDILTHIVSAPQLQQDWRTVFQVIYVSLEWDF